MFVLKSNLIHVTFAKMNVSIIKQACDLNRHFVEKEQVMIDCEKEGTRTTRNKDDNGAWEVDMYKRFTQRLYAVTPGKTPR